MDRRSWTGFLLIAAGFLAIGGDAPAKPQAWSLFSDGHPRAQVAPVGTVDPYQGAVEARHVERNSVTSDAVTANVNASRDSNVAPVPGAPPGAVPTTSGACPPDMVAVDGDYCTDVRHNSKIIREKLTAQAANS